MYIIKKQIGVFFSLIILGIGIIYPWPVSAQLNSPFGGQILFSQPCPCSANWLITIRPIGTATFQLIYRPGFSKLYKYGQIFRPGPYVLGTTLGVDVCLSGLFCVPKATAPLIRMIGTSL